MNSFVRSLTTAIAASTCFLACSQGNKKVLDAIELPKELKEVSGITYVKGNDILYAIEDSGNENTIYGLNAKAELVEEITIEGIENKDWEDITSDADGNLYIGDFGNNENARKDLVIYKVKAKDIQNKKVTAVEAIRFIYPEQTAFPPKKSGLFYDVEAFMLYNNNFYLFTKNRSKNFDGTTLLYCVPNVPGNHQAKLLGSFVTGPDYNHDAITGAALSPDKTKMALLSHSYVWVFKNFASDDFFNGEVTKMDLQHYSQKEAITFKDDATILIADEKTKKVGGKLYQYKIK